MTTQIQLDKSCGCKGDFLDGAIAAYGVRGIYSNNNENCWHTFDLAPTYAQLVAVNPEVEARFRKNLQGENGYISIARLMFREHEGFSRASEEFNGYHAEPTRIFDFGSCAFYAQKRGTYVYITWSMYAKPLDFEEASKWALTKEISEMMNEIRRRPF